MGIFESPCPFPYGNHHMETVIPIWKTFSYGDFYLNPQMGMNSIRKRVSDWTVPVRKRGPDSIRGSPYRNGYPFHLLSHMETGIHPFHMGMFLSPFPYGDHHMETGSRFIQLPIWKRGFPYGNGDWAGKLQFPVQILGKDTLQCVTWSLEVAKNTLPISIWGVPVRKWAGRVEYSHMGSPRFQIEFVSIWGLTYILITPIRTI